jgi:hypothetical protein
MRSKIQRMFALARSQLGGIIEVKIWRSTPLNHSPWTGAASLATPPVKRNIVRTVFRHDREIQKWTRGHVCLEFPQFLLPFFRELQVARRGTLFWSYQRVSLQFVHNSKFSDKTAFLLLNEGIKLVR